MKQVKRCKKCILPEHYPSIRFNSEGICSYCEEYDIKWGKWSAKESEIVSKLKSKKDPILLGISGGKDSCYTLHKLVNDYDIKNLVCYTYDNGFLADGAIKNIEILTSSLGVEHHLKRMDRDIERNLYKNAIKKKSSELCMFCMAPAVNSMISFSLKNKIKTIVLGSSPRTEPQFPFTMLNGFDYKYLKDIVEPDYSIKELDEYFKYINPTQAMKVLLFKKVEFINLPEYIDWDNRLIIETLKEKYGWVDYGDGVPHFDCMLEPAIDYFMYKRLGVSKIIENISTLVRRGHLTRDEALIKLEKEEIREIPETSIEEICTRLEINRSDLDAYINGETLDYSHFKNNVNIIKNNLWLIKILSSIGIINKQVYRKYKYD